MPYWYLDRVPLEVWREILGHVSKPADLTRASRTSKRMRIEAEAVLYRSVLLTDPGQAHNFLYAIGYSTRRRTNAVRSIVLDWQNSPQSRKSIVLILNAILTQLHALKHLGVMYLSNLAALLQDCNFQLRRFETNLPIGASLWPFFERQSGIKTLAVTPIHVVSRPDKKPSPLPAQLLPKLEIFTAHREVFRKLDRSHCITHLHLIFPDIHAIERAVELLGNQLVSLKLSSLPPHCNCHNPGLLHVPLSLFSRKATPRLVQLEFVVNPIAPRLQTDPNSTVNLPTDFLTPICLETKDALADLSLETVVWDLDWAPRRHNDSLRRSSSSAAIEREWRRTVIPNFVKAVLKSAPPLRRFAFRTAERYVSMALDARGYPQWEELKDMHDEAWMAVVGRRDSPVQA